MGLRVKTLERLAAVQRRAWFPRTDDEGAGVSRFGGVPMVSQEFPWPRCGHCQERMSLFLELSSRELPSGAGKPFGEGILQVFYCLNSQADCEWQGEAFLPFSVATKVRVFPLQGGRRSDENGPRDFPVRGICGWEEAIDFPHFEESTESGEELDDDVMEELAEEGFPLVGDKLLGWPAWVQGVEYATCPTCRKEMRFLFQIDSEDHLPYMFGDAGCAHIFQCPLHPEQMTLGWACS